MNTRIIRAIAIKDWQEVRQNRMAWAPVLVLPLIFAVGMPLLFILIPQTASSTNLNGTDMTMLLNSIPPSVREQVAGYNENQLLIFLILGYLLAPLFLILPLMTSSVIGADSFAGEKERKTIEALLYTPATERDLFFGKIIAALIPALLVTWGSFIIYTLILDGFGGKIMGGSWFPTPPWWPLILWVTPAVAVAGILATVLISARVNTFMAAYQSSSMLVLPLIILIVGQIGGVLSLGVETVIIVGVFIWLLDAVLLWFALRHFSRVNLMGTSGQN